MKLVISIIILFVASYNLFSQKLDDLKNQQLIIEKKIELINEQISKTEKQKQSASTNLKLINAKIELKNRLIRDLEIQEELIQDKIFYLTNSVDSLNLKISLGIDEYKRFLIQIQKKDFNRPLFLFILSSNSINEAYRRIIYYEEYLNYQKSILRDLTNSKKLLKEQKENLNINLVDLNDREIKRQNEIDRLKRTKEEQRKKEKVLINRRKDLTADLELNKSISKKLYFEIEKLIEEERLRILNEKSKKVVDQSKLLNKNFSDNIGHFAIPVANGVIVGKYGETDHPVLKNIKVKNNGIDISVLESTDVFSIFNGEVRKVFKIPGSKLAIIIRHGSYLTVYSNLTEVYVKNGTVVSTNQKIGHIKQSKDRENQLFHFEIWNENKSENPIKFFKD